MYFLQNALLYDYPLKRNTENVLFFMEKRLIGPHFQKQVFCKIKSKKKKPFQNWMKNKNSIYLPNVQNFGIWIKFR
jgi:hypothetical protein